MENVNDKTAKPAPTDTTTDTAAEGWNPYDYYDCRPEADTPMQTAEYIDNTRPWLKDALAKRQAELEAAPMPATPKDAPKKS
jgi:hypothetical protein